MPKVLLIYPPIAKPGEPPAGIARLKGILSKHHIHCSLVDASLEATHYILQQKSNANDLWSKVAFKNVDRNLKQIKSEQAFKNIDHYNRIVQNLNRVITIYGKHYHYDLGLADCTCKNLSPLKSNDLIQCATTFKENPFYDYYKSSLIGKIANEAPDMIGLSINYLSQALNSFALIGMIKKEFPNIIICLGGGLMTSWIRNGNLNDQLKGLVDYCVAGPGEYFFISHFNLKKNDLPYATPVFDDFLTLDYLSPGFVLPYNTSTGCYFRQCSFCPETAEKNVYESIPHGLVMDDLQLLINETKPSLIHFLDNALAPSLLKKFFNTSSITVPWYGYVRFTEELTDLDFCIKLKQSGCSLLKLGLESGDQAVLDQLHKGFQLKTASKILHNLKQVNIPTFIYLLFGTPYESLVSAQKTMDFVLTHHESITYINPAIFNMPIKSIESKKVATHPFYEGDLSLYVDFDHPDKWSRNKVRNFLDREFKRHPIIATILRRTPKLFTSNHAPFF